MARLNKRVWANTKLTEHTKAQVYKACVVSTLLYGSESWTTRAKQEHKLNAFHMRSLRRILGITWQDRVTNADVLRRANVLSMYSLLKQRRLRWLGHVVRMEDGKIPKDLLYGELVEGTRPRGRPKLRYKDVCKRALKALEIEEDDWEAIASSRPDWRNAVREGLKSLEENLAKQSADKRERRKASAQTDRPATSFVCSGCSRDCHSRIGLISHTGRCQLQSASP